MADYINKNILVQAYVHIENNLEDISVSKQRKMVQDLEDFAKDRAAFFLYPDVEVETELADGSIISKITILGTVSILMGFVKDYPSYREGVIAIASDAKRLADYMTSESMYQFGGKSGTTIRIEARTGVIGSLQKIVNKLERVRLHTGDRMELTSKELESVIFDISRLIHILKTDEDRGVVGEGLHSIATRIPNVPRLPSKGKTSPIIILRYIDDRKKLLALIKTMAPDRKRTVRRS